MKILEVIANTDFFLFLLGLFGLAWGRKLYKAIRKCGPKAFSYIFVIVVYFLIAWINL